MDYLFSIDGLQSYKWNKVLYSDNDSDMYLKSHIYAQYGSSIYFVAGNHREPGLDYLIHIDVYNVVNVNVDYHIIPQTMFWGSGTAQHLCIVADASYVYIVKEEEISIYNTNIDEWSTVRYAGGTAFVTCALTNNHQFIYVFSHWSQEVSRSFGITKYDVKNHILSSPNTANLCYTHSKEARAITGRN
eukprot:439871_1